MYIDYKFKEVTRGQNRTKAKVAITEGDFEDITYVDIDGKEKTINTYVRKKELDVFDYDVSGDLKRSELEDFCNTKLKEVRDKVYKTHSILEVQL
jgi:hypothetical protein